ncbi:hypothetical protein, partial [Vibrio crassostreae]|uniref:hypothetical protein n=1 Tax=Vibrio crassostreae TaxID=246167 RepID=UPI001C106187
MKSAGEGNYEYDGSLPSAISNEDIFNHRLKAIRFQKTLDQSLSGDAHPQHKAHHLYYTESNFAFLLKNSNQDCFEGFEHNTDHVRDRDDYQRKEIKPPKFCQHLGAL